MRGVGVGVCIVTSNLASRISGYNRLLEELNVVMICVNLVLDIIIPPTIHCKVGRPTLLCPPPDQQQGRLTRVRAGGKRSYDVLPAIVH